MLLPERKGRVVSCSRCTTIREGRSRRRSAFRAGVELAEWLIPSVLLVLMPKCPLCLAAYVALWTGIGLSFTAAAHIRAALIVLCVLSLAFLVATRVRRRILRSAHT